MSTQAPLGHYTLDTELLFKDSYAVTASAVAQVDSSDKIIDTGGTGIFKADMVIDVTAIDVASGSELYVIIIEGSDSATFASGIEQLAALQVGDSSVVSGAADVDSTTGLYILPFINQIATRRYRYLRVNQVLSGTTPSITYTAHAGQIKRGG